MTDDRRFWTVKQIRLADGRRGDVIRWDSKGDWFALDTDVVQARPDWQLVDVQVPESDPTVDPLYLMTAADLHDEARKQPRFCPDCVHDWHSTSPCIVRTRTLSGSGLAAQITVGTCACGYDLA